MSSTKSRTATLPRLQTKAYAAQDATSPLAPFSFERREVGEYDVLVEIDYCGICHSDLHQIRNEWGNAVYPMVPGHEIVGHVTHVGHRVTRFRAGDLAGVGCLVDSCRICESCRHGLEQFCERQPALTYNGTEMDRRTPTYGGYSNQIVVDEAFTLRIPSNLDLAGVAPLLCAGITTYSPLRHWKAGRNSQVAILGLGGLGHMAVKFAAAMGAEVTVLSSSKAKESDAKRLGAHEFVLTTHGEAIKNLTSRFDLIIDAASAAHDLNTYLNLLRIDGTMVLLGVPPAPAALAAFPLIMGRRSLSGSLIGGLAETQEMLDFCGQRDITSDIELVPMEQVNKAYERMLKGDVRYRFVLDNKSL